MWLRRYVCWICKAGLLILPAICIGNFAVLFIFVQLQLRRVGSILKTKNMYYWKFKSVVALLFIRHSAFLNSVISVSVVIWLSSCHNHIPHNVLHISLQKEKIPSLCKAHFGLCLIENIIVARLLGQFLLVNLL